MVVVAFWARGPAPHAARQQETLESRFNNYLGHRQVKETLRFSLQELENLCSMHSIS
jgi:hypothetical protein